MEQVWPSVFVIPTFLEHRHTYLGTNQPWIPKCGHPFNHIVRGASRPLYFDFEVPKEVREFSLMIINDILMVSGFKDWSGTCVQNQYTLNRK